MSEEPKRKPGGQVGNGNAAKNKVDPWPENTDYLDSPEAILAFQKRVAHDLYTGKLGARQGGAVNNALKTLLSYYVDAKKLAQYEAYFQRIKNVLDKEENEGKPA